MTAALLAGDGPVRALTAEEAAAYRGPGFLWTHLEGQDGLGDAVLDADADIPRVAASALIATETRPRCDSIGPGAIINLRGLGVEDPDDSDALVSIRMWINHNRVLSVSRRPLGANATVRAKMLDGHVLDAGDLVAAFAWAISTELDPEVAGLGDILDEVESSLESGALHQLRRRIMRVRSEAIGFRRFVAPDRDALRTLGGLGVDWLAPDDKLHIVEAADRFARMTEELEAVRERAALLHEQITDLRSEEIDNRSLYISIVAFIFLPLTFITGLLGMNVQGIPYASHPSSFWVIFAFCVTVAVGVFGWFYWRHWINR